MISPIRILQIQFSVCISPPDAKNFKALRTINQMINLLQVPIMIYDNTHTYTNNTEFMFKKLKNYNFISGRFKEPKQNSRIAAYIPATSFRNFQLFRKMSS